MVVSHLVLGILIAAIAWGFVFLIGSSLAIACAPSKTGGDESREPFDLLVATGAGVSCTILLIFVLASVKLLLAQALIPTLVVFVIVAISLAARRVGMRQLWAIFGESVRAAATPGSLAILAICIVLAVPALLPPSLFDDTMYHLPYALDWARAGGLVIDRYLRFPLAQFNIELLYATFFALHLDAYVQFVTWSFFALTATGIVTLTGSGLRSLGANATFAQFAGFLTAGVFVCCPPVLRYDDVAYVDIPAGAMLLAFAAAAFRARRNFGAYGFALAAIGGSFIGIKLALAPLSIVFALLIVWVARSSRASPKRVFASLAVLVVFAAPWFVRNALISGDPVDPVLNLAFRHSDLYWNQTDLDGQKRDLYRAVPLISVPVLMYRDPTFAGDSVSVSFVFLYIPFIALAYLAFRKRYRTALPDYAIGIVLVVCAILDELLVTDRLARYFLHFYALFLVVLAVTVWLCAGWIVKRLSLNTYWVAPVLTTILLVFFAIPSPGFSYTTNARPAFGDASLGVRDPSAYLSRVSGYAEADEIAAIIAASKTGDSVLAIQYPNLAYYFRKRNVESVGDWFGPGRLSDLASAIDTARLGPYIAEKKIGAVMIARTGDPFDSARSNLLFKDLMKLGFKEISRPSNDVREFVLANVLALAAKGGVVVEASDGGTSVNFLDRFADGTIGHAPRADYHTSDRSAFELPVLYDGTTIKSITVISGYTLSFTGIQTSADSVLSFDVAKNSWQGTPAIAWVDLTVDGKVRRVFSKVVPLAIGDDPQWTHVELPLDTKGKRVSLTFGAGSIAGGGTGDWISYVRPRLSHAKLEGRVPPLKS